MPRVECRGGRANCHWNGQQAEECGGSSQEKTFLRDLRGEFLGDTDNRVRRRIVGMRR